MTFWAVVNLCLLSVVALTAPARGLSRAVMPSVLTAVMLMTIFGIRPLFLNSEGPSNFYGLYTSSGWSYGLAIGVAAALGSAVGVALPHLKLSVELPQRSRPAAIVGSSGPGTDSLACAWRTRAWLATIVGVAGWAAIVVARSGFSGLMAQLGGRSEAAASSVAGLPVLAFLLPLAGSICAAVLISAEAAERSKAGIRDRILLTHACAMASISAISTLALGNRRFLIPAVLIPVIAYILANRARLRVIPAFFGSALVLFLAILPYVRSAGARLPGETVLEAAWRVLKEREGLSGVAESYFASYDTEMFDYLSYLGPRMGVSIPWGNGRATMVESVLSPLPAGWLDGPLYSDQILLSVFGSTCDTGACPVLSLPGTYYVDFGLAGVGVLMAATMCLLRVFERRHHKCVEVEVVSSPRRFVQSVSMLAVVGGYAIVLARTNSAIAVTWVAGSLLGLWMLTKYLYTGTGVLPADSSVGGRVSPPAASN